MMYNFTIKKPGYEKKTLILKTYHNNIVKEIMDIREEDVTQSQQNNFTFSFFIKFLAFIYFKILLFYPFQVLHFSSNVFYSFS